MAQQENCCFPWLMHCNLQLTHRSHWCWCRVNSLPTLTPRGILWKSPSLSHRRVKILCFTVLAALWPLKQPVQMNTAAVKRESVLRAPLQLAAAYGQMQMDLQWVLIRHMLWPPSPSPCAIITRPATWQTHSAERHNHTRSANTKALAYFSD